MNKRGLKTTFTKLSLGCVYNVYLFVLILMRISWWRGLSFFSHMIRGLGDPETLHFILSFPPWDTVCWRDMPDTLGLLTAKISLSLLDNAPNYIIGCVIQKRRVKKNYFFYLPQFGHNSFRAALRVFLLNTSGWAMAA